MAQDNINDHAEEEEDILFLTILDQVPISSFLKCLHAMLFLEPPHIVGWCKDGFKIRDMRLFESETLPYYFRHCNFASFQRQLNNFGFRKLPNRRGNVYGQNYFAPNHPGQLLLIQQQAQKQRQVESNSKPSIVNFTDELLLAYFAEEIMQEVLLL